MKILSAYDAYLDNYKVNSSSSISYMAFCAGWEAREKQYEEDAKKQLEDLRAQLNKEVHIDCTPQCHCKEIPLSNKDILNRAFSFADFNKELQKEQKREPL